jgi:hypothetical protein
VAGNHPGDDEDTEGDVAGGAVAHVLEQFGSLQESVKSMSLRCYPYRKNNVDKVHDTQNDGSDTHVIVSV